jgi:hypothetical protein
MNLCEYCSRLADANCGATVTLHSAPAQETADNLCRQRARPRQARVAGGRAATPSATAPLRKPRTYGCVDFTRQPNPKHT